MCAVAFNVILIDTLELTAFLGPSFVHFVPIDTGKVALSQHLILFNNVGVLKVVKGVIAVDEISKILVITHREREFNRDWEVFDICFIDNTTAIHCSIVVKEINFQYIRCHIVSIIDLIRIHSEFSNLCNKLFTKRNRRPNEVRWGNLNIGLLLLLDIVSCWH
jgi:hypothetical protein